MKEEMIEYKVGSGTCWRKGTFEEVEEYKRKIIRNRAKSGQVAENVMPKRLRLIATPGPFK